MIRAHDLTLNGVLPVAPGALGAHIGAVYAGYDMGETGPDGQLKIDFPTGSLTFRPSDGGLSIAIVALSSTDLFILREAVSSLLDGFAPDLAARVMWNKPLARTAHPPNFVVGTVLSVMALGSAYLRLRIAARPLTAGAQGGLHLRLLIPPSDRAAIWPTVSEAGRTLWPAGADALHDRVYTVRAMDALAGWVEVDIYRHGFGATCRWAASVTPGARVGLMGPGGGGVPLARHLVLAGDETALPAIARILAQAAPDTQGTALILVPDAAAIQTLSVPRGVRLRWLMRDTDGDLENEVTALDLPPTGCAGGRHLWIACEKQAAQRLRARYCVATGWARSETTIAAYWTRCEDFENV